MGEVVVIEMSSRDYFSMLGYGCENGLMGKGEFISSTLVIGARISSICCKVCHV